MTSSTSRSVAKRHDRIFEPAFPSRPPARVAGRDRRRRCITSDVLDARIRGRAAETSLPSSMRPAKFRLSPLFVPVSHLQSSLIGRAGQIDCLHRSWLLRFWLLGLVEFHLSLPRPLRNQLIYTSITVAPKYTAAHYQPHRSLPRGGAAEQIVSDRTPT
jgi:hypothetical protein